MRILLPLALVFTLAACGGSNGSSDAGTDSGLSGNDAGGTVDSGVDAGTDAGMDAGTTQDAGMSMDAGMEMDAGMTMDAGMEMDAGQPDGGTMDAGGPIVVTVGAGGLNFSPANVTIKVGDTVRWQWAASFHNVVSGSGCMADNKFCSPNDTNCATAATSMAGATYDHTFTTAGSFPYFCAPHCTFGMTGTVTVTP